MDQRRVGKPVTSLHHFLRCVLAGLCLITLALPAAEADEPAERLGAPEPAADANATPPGGQRRELVVNTSESVLVDAYGRLHQPDGTPAPASIVRNKHGDLVDLTHCTVYPGREEKELAYHRRRVGERQRQPTLRSTDAASLDALTAPSTTVTSSVFSYDVGDIAVLVDDGTLISGGSIDQVQAAIEFYRTHPDTFDFLMFFPNLDHTEGSFHSIVRNDTLGIGRTVMDNSLLYGSNHVLQSVTNYVNYATFPADPRARIPGNNDSSLSLIAQEAGHRWAAFAKFDTDPGPGVNSSSALLGRQGAHWCFFHHTESVGPANGASSLEGNTWSGTGPWTSTELTDGYSPLDLYLMGLREAAAVPPLFYIANPTGTSATCSATPTTGVTIDGTQTTVTMQQVLEAMGPRVPDAANAQRTYRQAFVLLAQSVPSQADIDKLEAIRSAWVSYFSVETLGLGIVDTSLGTPPPGPVAGFRLVLPTRPAINIPTRVSVVAVDANGTLVPSYTGTVQVATTDRFATLPPTVTIAPAATGIGSFAVTFRVAGAQELQVSDMSNGTWQGSATVDVAPVHFPVARRLTTEAHTQAAPAISGNLIVWEDQRNLNADIYLYDLGTGTERPLTTTLGDQRNPAIDGDGVVWEDASRVFYYDLATETGDRVVTRLAQPQRNPAISGDRIVWEEGQSADDIYLYDLTTNTETRLTIDIWAQRNPAISGNFVVWEDDRNGNTDIYLYDLTSNTQRQLTSHPAAQRNPAISGNFVVWEDDRNGNTDIYLYDLTSNTEMRLTADPAAQRNPAISGDFVVWKDERGAFPVIYWHDLTSGAEQPLAPAVSDQLAPAISDNQIVWQDSRAGNWEIYLGYAGGLTAIPVVTNPAGQGDPAISGNRIVWQDYRNGNADIYLYDLTTGTEMPITSDPAVYQAMPAISGNRIVWQDYRNGNADIYLYDLASGSETPLTTDPAYQASPAISGNFVVWQDHRAGNNADIYLYDLTTGTEMPITSDPAVYQAMPAISGNYIVWEDGRNLSSGGGYDIYLYDLTTNTERRITTDPDDQRNPAISGNRIVWQDYRNGNADIYLYDLASGSETPLITDPVGGISPAISGRHVAFAKGTDIGLVRWPSSVAWQLTLDSASQQFPSVDGNRVVWEDDRNGNLDIYMTTLPNRAPLLAPIGGQSVNEGDLLTFEVVGGDPEGMPASYAASNLPSGAAFGPSTPWFSWVPAFEQAGSYAVTFTVSDGVLQASETITITVTNTNRAPSLTVPGSQTVAESQSLTFSVSATDPDGDALTYGATNLPAGASFSTATQTFAWTPSCSQGGTSYAVTFTASDGALQASQAVAITVTDVPTCGSGGGRRRKPVLREAL